ncbi:hypothetical protein GCM10009823_34030 [Brevibacterium salitolerans]|uniref:Uncharacterized protein n=1 Tax=Brevibacterium salitolerans TaxID=1403566 RepID=A0ABN2X9R3_9MICO
MPGLGIVAVGIEKAVRAIRLVQLRIGDRGAQPPIAGLTDELENPFPARFAFKREVSSLSP